MRSYLDTKRHYWREPRAAPAPKSGSVSGFPWSCGPVYEGKSAESLKRVPGLEPGTFSLGSKLSPAGDADPSGNTVVLSTQEEATNDDG
jgi:hypothetical protein